MGFIPIIVGRGMQLTYQNQLDPTQLAGLGCFKGLVGWVRL